MASERQIAANPRNARNSSGPRSGAGKKRASRNSYRHGFRARTTVGAQSAQAIEKLARQIAGANADALTLDNSRTAARAQFDRARIRQVKVAPIETIAAVGKFETWHDLKPLGKADGAETFSKPVEAEAPMPSTEPELHVPI